MNNNILRTTRYLVISAKKKPGYSSRTLSVDKILTKTDRNTSIPSNSVVLKLDLEVPEALFIKPQLEASIKVPIEAVSKPIINPETIDNISSIINQQLGIDLKISLINNLQEEA